MDSLKGEQTEEQDEEELDPENTEEDSEMDGEADDSGMEEAANDSGEESGEKDNCMELRENCENIDEDIKETAKLCNKRCRWERYQHLKKEIEQKKAELKNCVGLY